MKKIRLVEMRGFSSIFILVGMLLVAVALPIATRLVQQNQENRSNAAITSDAGCASKGGSCKDKRTNSCNGSWKTNLCTGDKNRVCCVPSSSSSSTGNDNKCKNKGGKCQMKSNSCNGSYESGLCLSNNNKDYQCCVPKSSSSTSTTITQDSTCTTKGGKCQNKATSCNGVYKDSLCKSSGSDIKCCVPSGSSAVTGDDSGCNSIGGTCTTGSCTGTFKTGLCTGGADRKCCVPNSSFGYYWNGSSCVKSTMSCSAVNWPSSYGVCYSSEDKCKAANPSTPSKSTYWYYDSSSKTCKSGDYASITGCEVSNKKCWNSNSACTSAHTFYYYGGSLRGCLYYITSTVFTCASELNTNCYTSKDPCESANNTSNNQTFYYYDSSSKSCKSGSYSSVATCNAAHSICYDSGDKCKTANSCAISKGECRTVCGSNEKLGGDSASCRPAVCCVPNTTAKENGVCNPNYNGKTLATHPTDAQACTKGGVYWTDISGSSGYFKWKCQGINGGSDVECKATVSCTSKGGACITGVKNCTEAEGGKILSGTDCSSGQVCCVVSDNPLEGSVYNPNSAKCAEAGGVCATYSSALGDKAKCKVAGYSSAGSVIKGLCGGDSKTVCCSGLISQDKECKDKNGVCQKDSNKCSGSYLTGYCPKSASNIKCCVPKSSGGGGGGTPTDPGTPDVLATGITLNPTSLNLAVGNSGVIQATVVPSDTTDKTVTWSSGATNVAIVSEGTVTAKAVGSAVITAKTSNNKTATASVTVVAAGTTTTPVVGSPRISFKFSLRGVKPSYTNSSGTAYNCFDKLGDLKVDVSSRTNVYQLGLPADFTVVPGETNAYGDQIFKVSVLALDSKFNTVGTDNYIKVKGPFHIKRRMCLNGQTSKQSETTTCNISLVSDTVYNFAGYTLLAGDVNADGIINSIDYGYVKTRFDASAAISCGREGDLNMDGVVNAMDANLIKDALSTRDDE